jgi:DNA-binding transcriptional regulator GbsR (MarR family)
MTDFDPDTLSETARTVFEELTRDAPMTRTDLIEATDLPFLAVTEGLEELQSENVVDELVYSHGRLRLYLLDVEAPDAEGREQAAVA